MESITNLTNLTANDSNVNMNMNLAQSPGFVDELEGIINNEPLKNKYETVKFHKLNKFPFFLIGKVVSKFDFDGVSKFLNGVGMLIGPDILLTVAHNLCHMSISQNGAKKIYMSKKVCFFAAANGDFNPFEPIKSQEIYVPPAYINSLENDDREEQLNNDWGLVYLSAPVGDQVISILDVEKTNYIKIYQQGDNKFYQFFTNNQNLNLLKLAKQTKSKKISIVGYTEFKDTYKNNSAYKFLNNFTKNENHQERNSKGSNHITPIINAINTGMTQNNQEMVKLLNPNFATQGKIYSEYLSEKEKNININISINTDSEGIFSNPRKNNPQVASPDISSNGLDYIILNNEEFNKDFDSNDVDKLIMSESKGNLIISEEEEMNEKNLLKAIRYQISTYKGQSGSPIFLRIKKITDKNKSMKNTSSDIYQFVGLHSRRGPLAGEQKFYESEKMNALTENMMTSDIKTLVQINTQEGLDRDSDKNMKSGKEININNEIIKQNGMCEYNIALSIIGESIGQIKDIVKTKFGTQKESYNYLNENECTEIPLSYEKSESLIQFNGMIDHELKSDFILTKIYLNDSVQLSGLFKKNVSLSVIFAFGSKIFNVPKEYILLKDINDSEYSNIHNFNFDCNKKYYEIMQDSENCQTMNFELMLNIKKYGENMSNKILQKFLENYDLEESQLKKDFEKKYMKQLFHSIFAEIASFENIHPTYGKLFKKIRKTILKKLDKISN
jgi:V8-like Glu-specific endopeptidase